MTLAQQFESDDAIIGVRATGFELLPEAEAAGAILLRAGRFIDHIAAHEAGHTAVSRLLGLPIAGCTINFVDGHHGLTWSAEGDAGRESVADLCNALSPMMPPLFDDRADIAKELLQAHHQVVSLLAGPLSEEIFLGSRLAGSEHDDLEAADIGRLICRSASALPAYLDCARAEASGLLRDNRAVVGALAHALVERRALNGCEIDLIIRKTLKC
jgi:hypothetical protein